MCCTDFLEQQEPSTVQQPPVDQMDTDVPDNDGVDNDTPQATPQTQTRAQETPQIEYDLRVQFYERTCGCKKGNGKPCSLFPLEHFVDMSAQVNIMTHQELDLVLLRSLMMTMHNGDETVAHGRHKPAKRQIVSHYRECGMEPRVHKNTKWLPPNAASQTF